MGSRIVALLLIMLLVGIHVQLWSGRASLSEVHGMRVQLATQHSANQRAQQANDQLGAEIEDLRRGLDLVEEKARNELGMVKPGEVYVHVASDPRKSAP